MGKSKMMSKEEWKEMEWRLSKNHPSAASLKPQDIAVRLLLAAYRELKQRRERDARMKDVEKMRPIIRAELPPWVGLVDAEVDRIARAVSRWLKGE